MTQSKWLRRIGSSAAVAAATLVAVGSAQAATIGTTTLPSGAKMTKCTGTGQMVQTGTSASNSYVVPAGGGQITSWSFNATGATAATPYTLLVLRPQGGSSYTIVGTDPETVPKATTIASFTLAKPITVQPGDVIGAAVTSKSTVGCLMNGSTVPAADTIARSTSTTLTAGTTLTVAFPAQDTLTNVAATVTQSNDVSITQQAEGATVTQGDNAVFVLSVANTGPSSTPVTITDTLPSGLSLVSASAGAGTCTTSGRTVTCSLPSAPANVAIVAAPTGTGSFTNTASVSGLVADPNTANNTSTASVQVQSLSDAEAATRGVNNVTHEIAQFFNLGSAKATIV